MESGVVTKKQKQDSCNNMILDCLFMSYGSVDQRGQFFLIKFANGSFYMLSPGWDMLSGPITESGILKNQFVTKKAKAEQGIAFLNVTKIDNLICIAGKPVTYSLLACLVESNPEYTKEHFVMWLVKGVPMFIMQPFIEKFNILDFDLNNMLSTIDINDVYSGLSCSKQHVISVVYSVLKQFGKTQRMVLIKNKAWSTVKHVLAWKGRLAEVTNPVLLSISNMERNSIFQLLFGRKQRNCLFNLLPLDILRYHLVPLICWSLPISLPLILV
jgi:hypothetical protein